MLWKFELGTNDPRAALATIVGAVQAADDSELLDLGVGPLESLLFENEEELWPELERLARSDPRFRRALRSVWAYESPKYRDREALLWELGEWTRVNVRFAGFNDDLSADAPMSNWRALEVDGAPLEEVMALLDDIVQAYKSGRIGPGHRDHPHDGVKLFTSESLDPVRSSIEEALSTAGLALVAPEDWETSSSRDPRPGLAEVRLKVRHHPDGATSPAQRALAIIPSIAALARAQAGDDTTVAIRVAVALPDDGYLSYGFVLGSRLRTGLRYEQLAQAVAAIPPTIGASGAQYLWGPDGWNDVNEMIRRRPESTVEGPDDLGTRSAGPQPTG